jgi:hypothetical protein
MPKQTAGPERPPGRRARAPREHLKKKWPPRADTGEAPVRVVVLAQPAPPERHKAYAQLQPDRTALATAGQYLF